MSLVTVIVACIVAPAKCHFVLEWMDIAVSLYMWYKGAICPFG